MEPAAPAGFSHLALESVKGAEARASSSESEPLPSPPSEDEEASSSYATLRFLVGAAFAFVEGLA